MCVLGSAYVTVCKYLRVILTMPPILPYTIQHNPSLHYPTVLWFAEPYPTVHPAVYSTPYSTIPSYIPYLVMFMSLKKLGSSASVIVPGEVT